MKMTFTIEKIYHQIFVRFIQKNNIEIKELCKSKKGRSVPYVSYGNGDRIILMTARHHACEATGNYVMEGVIEGLIDNPVPDTRVVCVPFVDFDGVVDGDDRRCAAGHQERARTAGKSLDALPDARRSAGGDVFRTAFAVLEDPDEGNAEDESKRAEKEEDVAPAATEQEIKRAD